ncbi:hypothetical protein X943_001131 [Babesia divergens]|uniref:Uncharacterized protein n=1 Tax=Babesia divergens TaxID=32595 RepID=A0AAD9GF74_BABDI|nr:hypothetical protein X943_001131 [Babesia divergens]
MIPPLGSALWFFLLVFATVSFHVDSFRIQQHSDNTELSKPPSWQEYRNEVQRASLSARRPSCLAATSTSTTSTSLEQQHVEDGILFTHFTPLNADASAPSQNDPARKRAATYFREVDCSGGKGADSIASAVSIPYDEMQLAFFQGDEVVDVVFKNTQEILNIACEQILQFHKSRIYVGLSEDSDRNSANAMRSIRCLIYWIGGRILNCAKGAMDRVDQNPESDATQTEVIRRTIENRIRKFVEETLHYWNGIIRPKEVDLYPVDFSRSGEASSPEDYVSRLWDYLNTKVFNGTLPEFADMRFSWYNMIDKDDSVIPTFNGELFRYLRKDDVAFPGLAYPKELSGREAALGNCVFRSMLKLYCDMFGPRFSSDDYVKTVVTAYEFVESEEALRERISFSSIQKDMIGSKSELRSFLPHFNSCDNMRDADVDIMDSTEFIPNIDQFPYMKNPISFSDIKEVVKDSNTALDIYDMSFRPQSYFKRTKVVEEIQRSGLELDIEDKISPFKVKLPDNTEDYEKSGGDNSGMDSVASSSHNLELLWKLDGAGNLTVPVCEIQRALVYGDLEKFGNIMSLAMNDLIKLKPVQLNGIQNKVVSLCIKALNEVRALDTYTLNYSLTPEDHHKNQITGDIQRLNSNAIQCILFVYKLIERCLTHNGLFPLNNSFMRTRPLELLLKEANALGDSGSTSDVTQFGAESVKMEAEMKPVPFPQEYINDAVAADDPLALRFLVNYYNYNLFGGRLPIDIDIKFEPSSVDEYLSSHDDSSYVLKVPRIYINPLVRGNKVLVARLILEECFNLFLRWSYRFNSPGEGRSDVMVTDIVESDISSRMRRHIANCIETAGDWPFFFDNLHYMAPYEQSAISDLPKQVPLNGRKLGQVFRDLLNTNVDIVSVMSSLVERTEMTALWERQILPIRHFVNALQGGDYDLLYTIMANSSSIKATCHLPISTINSIENKFKEACQISHALDERGSCTIGEDRQRMNSLVNLEAIKCVECAFDELREQATKHHLIAASDLTQGITEATDNLARCQPEEVDHRKADANYTLLNINNAGIPTEVRTDNRDNQVVDKYIHPSNNEDPSAYDLNAEERPVCAEAIYRAYNDKLFNKSLPQDVKIEFVDDLEDLSTLDDNMHSISPPTIKLNSLLSHAKILFLHMILQMVNISFMYSTHNVELDCLRYFSVPYRSAFKQFHINQQQYLRSRLLPISREARMKAKASAKDGCTSYVQSLKDAAEVKYESGSQKSLLDMEIDEFVDEVLDGRTKIHSDNKDASLCNPFEEYQALQSFANHFVNWKRTRMSFQDVVTIESNLPKGDPKALQFVNNTFIRTVWSRFKFEHLENVLKTMGIEMPLSKHLGLNWQPVLNEDQQFKMIKYLTLLSAEDDNVFTILVRSGACTPKEAFDVLIKLADPHLKLEPYPDEPPNKARTADSPTMSCDATMDPSQDDEPNFGSEAFSNEIQALTSTMDLDTAETVHMLVDKLMRRNYSDALGILSSHPKRSYLKEMVLKFLDVIRNNGVLKDRHHIEILEFLRN